MHQSIQICTLISQQGCWIGTGEANWLTRRSIIIIQAFFVFRQVAGISINIWRVNSFLWGRWEDKHIIPLAKDLFSYPLWSMLIWWILFGEFILITVWYLYIVSQAWNCVLMFMYVKHLARLCSIVYMHLPACISSSFFLSSYSIFKKIIEFSSLLFYMKSACFYYLRHNFLYLWRMSFTQCTQLKFFKFIPTDYKEWSILQNILDMFSCK